MAHGDMSELLKKCIADIEDAFEGPEDTFELKSCVVEIIPLATDEYKIIKVKGNEAKFKVTFKCLLRDSDVNSFVDQYNKANIDG